MRFLGLDCETKDPYISLNLGPGWPTKCLYGNDSLFYVIGWSYCWYDDATNAISRSEYLNVAPNCPDKENNLARIKDLIKEANNRVVMHNAQYDIGGLRSHGIDTTNLIVYDTKIMAILFDSSLYSFSLDPLLAKYLKEKKAKNRLIDIIVNKNLCPNLKQSNKTFEREAMKWAYSNMPVLQEADFKAMADYANQDTHGMMKLFRHYKLQGIDMKLAQYYSHGQLLCTKMREPGICVDLDQLEKGIEVLQPIVDADEKYLWKEFGSEFNLHANELKEQMIKKGYKLPKTAKGNDSINASFFEEHPNDPLCRKLIDYRTNYILLNQFLIKIKEMQQYTAPESYRGREYGRVFPELNLLAARTGRFSSSNPNIQNIPKRNKAYASLCRAIFVPNDRDNTWYSLDWSNQEGRIQLHYAHLKGLSGSRNWLKRFKANPELDTHSLVAQLMGNVERSIAKTIYLGKSYCMGQAKTCKRLGLETVIDKQSGREVAGVEGAKLIAAYDYAFPYLKELQKECTYVIRNRGHIVTLGGRKLKRPPFYRNAKGEEQDFDYKAISLLIQGSAADQGIAALHMADKAGIDIKCMVHDEFNIEGNAQDAAKMKEIMETCSELEVPSVVEVSSGKSWGFMEKLK